MSIVLLAIMIPSGAAPAADPEDPWLVFVASDGSYGIGRQSEVLRDHGFQDWHQVGFQHCYGTSPVEDTCTLQAYVKPFPSVYLTGWLAPTLPHDPNGPLGILPENGAAGSVGVLVASTHLEVTGDMFPNTKILYDCTWATPGIFGQEVPNAVTCKVQYIYPPGTPLSERYPRGNVTVDFDNGFYDASVVDPSLPSTASPGPAVGTWHAILYAAP